MIAAQKFGAFGKIPSLGDFFTVDLPRGFVGPWDAYLQSLMTSARSAIGGEWNDAYLTAPIWRFSIAAGLAGPNAALGVVMPSVDRVGRQFPLTLAATLAEQDNLPALHLNAGDTFERLEDVALAQLENGAELAGLKDGLGKIAVPLSSETIVVDQSADATSFVSTGSDMLPALAARALQRGAKNPGSTWSTIAKGKHIVVAFDELPGQADAPLIFAPETLGSEQVLQVEYAAPC